MSYSNTGKFRGNEAYLQLAAIDAEPVLSEGRTKPTVRRNFTVECNLSGRGAVYINGRKFDIEKGDCYILFPGDIIEYYSSRESPRLGIWCVVGGNRIAEALRVAGISSEQPMAPPECFDRLCAVIERMRELNGRNDVGSEYLRTALVYELIGILTEGRSDGRSEIWLSRALDIMETRYNKPLNVTDISNEVGFERSYFSTVFKERVGKSPHEYLMGLRISEACRMLERGLSVSEVALAVGLEPKNFARAFRARMTVSAAEYRRKSLNKKG